ncbi:MAG: conjugal transfer protein TraH [Desulfobacterales bacterium]|nr:conjugal transfer protein TraH [Desulfobacterales bacterium]
MRLKQTSIILSLVFVFIAASNSSADWVDDWINQSVVTGPDNFETQKRNYATFGNMSARWSTHADPLVSISKPRFTAGCGGIDAYLGGFSFMQFDYLVQKLQRIMGPAAAAFAFDIALNTLCEPCANSIKAFEAIVDRLNQLQLDDCKAGKVVATTILDGATDSQQISSERTQAWTDFAQSTGAVELWQAMKESAGDKTPENAKDAAGGGITSDNLIAQCPALMKQAFFTDGSLLKNLSDLRGYPGAYVNLMRGLIGDVTITNSVNHKYIPPCVNNNTIADVSPKIYTGEIEAMNATGTCAPLSSTGITVNSQHYNSYRDWVISTLTNITNKMMTGAAFIPEELSMLQNTPENAYTALKGYLLNMGQDADPGQAALQFERLVGKHYIYSMFSDYHKYLDDILSYAQYISGQQMGSSTGDDQKSCQLTFIASTLESLKDMKNKTGEMMRMAYLSYSGVVKMMRAEQGLNRAFIDAQKRGAARIQSTISRATH